MKIKKVLIANRGEIALRIIRTLREMNIKSIALYTAMETDDLHVKKADQAVLLGNGTLNETWLNIPLIIKIACDFGADAIHPGYGFLSENDAFAKACEQEGIIFIGPSSEVIEMMGSKITASMHASNADIPLLPRLEGSTAELLQNGPRLGFPLLVKAAAGGGGKGMIRIESAEMLQQAVFSAAEQAKRYFADDKVYLEKYVQNPRHIEVQILADSHGNVVHLFERECTLQRNHQKVVEEAPSPSLNPDNRKNLLNSAVTLAKRVGYRSAGTIEFILDEDGNFFFLEMNTRIQVEHPVTEAITGIDIVKEQILVAMGHPLSFSQEQIHQNGHAIEVRLYAEDPANHFRPSAGIVRSLVVPESKNVRVDSAIENSGKVHPSFDAMISKIITHRKNRQQAIEEMDNALAEILVHGITTNINLLSNIIKDEIYRENRVSTHSIADNITRWSIKSDNEEKRHVVAGLFFWLERFCQTPGQNAWRMASAEKVTVNGHELTMFIYPYGAKGVTLIKEGNIFRIENISISNHKLHFTWNNMPSSVVFSYAGRNAMFLDEGIHYHVILPDPLLLPKAAFNGKNHFFPELRASLFGRVLRVNVSEKQQVKAGEPLLILESMKMENQILAPNDQIVSRINVKDGDQVSDGQVLISFEPVND